MRSNHEALEMVDEAERGKYRRTDEIDAAPSHGFGYRVPEIQRVFAGGTQKKDKSGMAFCSHPVYI